MHQPVCLFKNFKNDYQNKKMRKMIYLGLAFCAILGMMSCSNDDDNSPFKPSTLEDKYITVNQVKLHYRDWGNIAAPPLIVLHGYTGHAWEFDQLAGALSDEYHVYSINQRGHGDSDWAETYNLEVMADDIAGFIEALNLGKATVVGHSMGGVNAWWLASKHPEKMERLVLLDIEPQIISSSEIVGLWQEYLAYYAQSEFNSLEEGVAEYMASYEGNHQEALETFAKNNLKQNEAGKWVWKFDAENLIQWMQSTENSEQEQWELLQDITCPTLIVKAGSSPFTDMDAINQMDETIPNSEVAIVPDSGHDIHIEQYDLLLNTLKTFFN